MENEERLLHLARETNLLLVREDKDKEEEEEEEEEEDEEEGEGEGEGEGEEEKENEEEEETKIISGNSYTEHNYTWNIRKAIV